MNSDEFSIEIILFSMFLVLLKLTSSMLVYFYINPFNINISTSIILTPIFFICISMMTELYGSKIVKKIIIFAWISQVIFTTLLSLVISLKYVNSYVSTKDIGNLFISLPKTAIASGAGTLLGGIITSHLLYKYKLIYNSKFFILRCLLISMFGELIYTIITDFIAFFNIAHYQLILKLIISSFIIKSIIDLTLLIPAKIIVYSLKR